MRRIIHCTAWLSIFLVFAGLRCMSPLSAKGSSSETVIGKVINADGSPACSTIVTIYPSDYDPVQDEGMVLLSSDTTDAAGAFSVEARDSSVNYSIVAIRQKSRTRALLSGIIISGDTTRVEDAVLALPGVIVAGAPDSADLVNGYLYIPGTGIAAFFGNGRTALLDQVPAGIISSVNYRSGTASGAPLVLASGINIAPNDTTVIPYPQWRYSINLHLNTASSGAGISGNVFDFPVLVRLSAETFDFGQARNDGTDIRFAKLNGVSLPFEIERWDVNARRAEIWVTIDTIRGNDSNQSVTMFWGNPNASVYSNGAAVFDTSFGFAGVWHMGENEGGVVDATGNSYTGMNSGTTAAAGMIGNGRNFVNGNFIKVSGLFNTPANVTLSAWVNSDTMSWGLNNNRGQEVVSLGDYALVRLDDTHGLGVCGTFQNKPIAPGPDSSFVYTSSIKYLANTGWHFVAYSINTAAHTQVLYIDGVQAAVTNDVNPICYSGLGTDTYIGIHANGEKIYNFSGLMDEVRVNNSTKGADWIRLCYMNQKNQDALVKFE